MDPEVIVQDSLTTEDEAPLLQELKDKVIGTLKGCECGKFPEVVSDIRLLRFLRGFENDVSKAEQAVLDMIRQRRKWGLDKVRNECVNYELETATWANSAKYYPDEEKLKIFNKYIPQFIDSTHNLVSYVNYSKCDNGKLFEHVDLEDVRKFLLIKRCCVEIEIDRLSKERNKLVQQVIILDCAGLSLSHLSHIWSNKLWRREIQPMNKHLNSTHAEFVGKIFVLHLPWYAKPVVQAVKIGVPKRTLDKVHFLANDHDPELVKVLGKDVFKKILQFRGELDATDHDTKNLPYEEDQIIVSAGKAHEIHFTAKKGLTVSWEFSLQSHEIDLKISALVEEEEDVSINVIEHRKGVKTGTCKGEFVPKQDGVHSISFDNHKSWIRSKQIEKFSLKATPFLRSRSMP